MSTPGASTAVLAVRSAVRRALSDVDVGSPILAACSGGPDSTALVGALGWVAARDGRPTRAIVVDHGLQPDSAEVAARAAVMCDRLGVGAHVVRVTVSADAQAGSGPEAAARDARYAALDQAADEFGAGSILLGHTREDQAETVLLRLLRGSGARSLGAMAPRSGRRVRPFLHLPRALVHEAASDLLAVHGLTWWRDPHNADPHFARVRARRLLERLAAELGPGVVSGLARSADLLRADADELDRLADAAVEELAAAAHGVPTESGVISAGMAGAGVDCAALAALPLAVRSRVLRRLCLSAGSPADQLSHDHVVRVDALVTAWRGQGPVALPGRVEAARVCGRLCLRPSPARPGDLRGA